MLAIADGPAGLEATRILALRGHRVTLLGERETLGGTLVVVSVPEFKTRLYKLVKCYEVQLNKLRVEVLKRTKATPELIQRLKPDAVVVATGFKPLVPRIPGVEYAVTAGDVLLCKAPVGEKVVVIGGGLAVGESRTLTQSLLRP